MSDLNLNKRNSVQESGISSCCYYDCCCVQYVAPIIMLLYLLLNRADSYLKKLTENEETQIFSNHHLLSYTGAQTGNYKYKQLEHWLASPLFFLNIIQNSMRVF